MATEVVGDANVPTAIPLRVVLDEEVEVGNPM